MIIRNKLIIFVLLSCLSQNGCSNRKIISTDTEDPSILILINGWSQNKSNCANELNLVRSFTINRVSESCLKEFSEFVLENQSINPQTGFVDFRNKPVLLKK